ncbi:cellulose binding domain-containing protein [Planomonospora sp. ID67723]|uniref:chitinase n=1 Tax=Planomonospora sp. ID67723 TaxID=2738134 RepID=UPI0018C3E934|nr:cellulose binding domain-containing protein [Planomonospora sp. ID67723]MBG0828634.1 cellulose binding domain-containing protein [Planomonospora sp. ID67723]
MKSRLISRSLVALTALLLTAPVAPPAQAAGSATATFTKVGDWGSGFEGRYTIKNGTASTISSWKVEFDLPAGVGVGSFWDATLTRSGQHFTFSNVGWNGTLAPGASVTFGFLGSPGGAAAVPAGCKLNGADCGGGDGPTDPVLPGKPGTPIATGGSRSIALSWTASSGTVTGYRVYEGTAVKATVTGTSATVSGLGDCETHTYTVRAYNAEGESPASAEATATTTGCAPSPLPKHFLTGYWHNFDNAAVELKLSAVPAAYDLVAVSFGEATATPGEVVFGVDPGLSASLGGYTDAQFKADVKTLQSRGQKVILSVGGELGRVQVASATAAATFADTVHGLMQQYGFDGVDIDLENGLNATYMGQALRALRAKAGANLIITMAPQTIDMQSTGAEYFKLALNIKDILTVVHTQYYNSGSMLGCDQMAAYSQGTVNFMTALACIQLENGLRPDQVALGLPAGPGAAGGGIVAPALVNQALTCLATRTNCGSFVPPRAYPGIRGAMTWSINWDASNNWNFSKTVKPHLATLP